MKPQFLVFVVFLVLARHVPVTYGISSHASDAYSQHKRNTERIADQVRQKGGTRDVDERGRRSGAGRGTHMNTH